MCGIYYLELQNIYISINKYLMLYIYKFYKIKYKIELYIYTNEEFHFIILLVPFTNQVLYLYHHLNNIGVNRQHYR